MLIFEGKHGKRSKRSMVLKVNKLFVGESFVKKKVEKLDKIESWTKLKIGQNWTKLKVGQLDKLNKIENWTKFNKLAKIDKLNKIENWTKLTN